MALTGVFAIILQFLLISRARWLEPYYGLDKLTRLHHWNGLLAITLIYTHMFTIILGYSLAAKVNYISQYFTFVFHYEDVWQASFAAIILFFTVGLSLYIVRKHLKYETWYYVHLLNYLVIILAFGHQLENGGDFISNDVFRVYWVSLYVILFLNVVGFRFLRPAYLYWKHRFRVEKVVAETPTTNSIYITGRKLEKFKYKAGQFNKWWFFAKGYWLEEHPFTISVEPNGKYLRLTPKMVGDFTEKLKKLPSGTPVLIDGAYGIFTNKVATKNKILFIAGGIGITPIRAMLGELAKSSSQKDVVLLYSVRDSSDIPLRDELDKITDRVHLKIVYILSDRKEVGYEFGRLDKDKIQNLVGDIKDRDVYICGPPPMMKALEIAALELGADKKAVHMEKFSLH